MPGYTPNPTLLGATGTGNILATRRPLDVSDDIAFYNPNANPLMLLAQKSNKKATVDPKFIVLESQMQPYTDAINNAAGYTTSDTSITVDHGTYFKANDLILNVTTDEIMLCTAVSSNALTVVRGYGSVGAQNITDNDELRVIGNCFEEGGAADSSKTVKIDEVYNYTQIFKTSLTVTRTVQNTQLYGGNEITLRQKQNGIVHATKIENALLFGQRLEKTTSSTSNPTTNHPRRTSGGLKYFISSNAISINGTLNEATFNNEYLRYMFEADKNVRKKRTHFVSAKIGSIMNQWANGKIQLVPSDQTFGITVNRYLSFFGEIAIIHHPLLDGGYSGYMFTCDVENIGYRYLTNSDTSLSTDIVQDGSDQRVDQFLTECGLEVKLEGLHGYGYGITG